MEARKCYERPMMFVQNFVPNEYVAACVTGTIQCAIPGSSPYQCNDGTSAKNFDWWVYRGLDQNWNGPTIQSDGLDHGICGETTSITFSDSDGSGSGFEMNHGVLDRSRPIYNISGYDLSTGTYSVTWKSNNGYSEYNHYGILTIENIDNTHPNHS